MRIRILNSKEKKEFEESKNVKIEGMIIEMNGKLRVYTGNLSREELLKICREINVIRIGLKIP